MFNPWIDGEKTKKIDFAGPINFMALTVGRSSGLRIMASGRLPTNCHQKKLFF
jgi:hypothetical protein